MKLPLQNTPCRLSVILASGAQTGVVFRRGPSKWVQIIKWDTGADKFEEGHWFHGRIREDQCDLSSDGTKLLYRATKYPARGDNVGTDWTAISKAPYLTALVLFAHKGFGTQGGGGLFMSDNEIWIASEPAPGTKTFLPAKGTVPPGIKITAHLSSEDISAIRYKREGWKHQGSNGWEKKHPQRPISLCRLSQTKLATGGGFVIKNTESRQQMPINGAEWADWDQTGRLVFTKAGKLYAGYLNELSEGAAKEIADFNDNTPESIETPEWARTW